MVQPSTTHRRTPVLIAGPTASGKSSLALEIADRVGGVIVNADALQVYANWCVLSARPDKDDLDRHPHLLYGHVPPRQAYSVGDWLGDMEQVIAEADAARRRLIIVGGTGMYLTSLTQGLSRIPPIPDSVRQLGDEMRRRDGTFSFVSDLSEGDPAGLKKIDQNNPARLQRAWEVLRSTGRPLHHWQKEKEPPLIQPQTAMTICLHAPPDWLKARIEGRFAAMVETGALDECRAWKALDLSFDLPSGKAIGARELCLFLDGEMSLEQAIDKAQIATRQYAKRQRTWFRSRMSDWTALEISKGRPVADIASRIEKMDTQGGN